MANLDTMIARLRELNEPVPRPLRLPTEAEVRAMEAETGVTFPPDFVRYLLEASDVVFDVKEPVTITRPKSHTHFPRVLESGKATGLPKELIPICCDNGDFFAVAPSGEVVFWSHNGWPEERWTDIATWIEEVWIGEADY